MTKFSRTLKRLQCTFCFCLGEEVMVKQIMQRGVVHARSDCLTGGQVYRVIYWWEGERRDEWLYRYELETIGE